MKNIIAIIAFVLLASCAKENSYKKIVYVSVKASAQVSNPARPQYNEIVFDFYISSSAIQYLSTDVPKNISVTVDYNGSKINFLLPANESTVRLGNSIYNEPLGTCKIVSASYPDNSVTVNF